MADRQEVEAVAEALSWADSPDPGGRLEPNNYTGLAAAAIAALDRVRAERAESYRCNCDREGEQEGQRHFPGCPVYERTEAAEGMVKLADAMAAMAGELAAALAERDLWREDNAVLTDQRDQAREALEEQAAPLIVQGNHTEPIDAAYLVPELVRQAMMARRAAARSALDRLSGDKENPQSDGAWSRSGDPSGETHLNLGLSGDKENPR